MSKKAATLYVDQYGNYFFAKTVRELRSQIGGGGSRVSRMYRDIGGERFHVGYVVGQHWLAAYVPVFKKTKPGAD